MADEHERAGSREAENDCVALFVGCMCLVAALAGCGKSEPAPVVKPAVVAPPPAPPPPPEIKPIADVVVKPGATVAVPIEINRNGNQGIVELVVETPPEGLSAGPVSIPAGTSRAELRVTAAATLGEYESSHDVKLSGMLNGMPFEGTFRVTVPPYEPPEVSLAGSVLLMQGATREVTLRCDRKGFPGPIGMVIGEPPPNGLTCSVKPLDEGQDSTTLQISVADETEDGTVTIPLVATIRDKQIPLSVALPVIRFPFRIGSMQAVMIAPGESRQLTLSVERNGHDGPLEVEAHGLPEGVEMPPLSVAADARSIDVELRCGADTAEQVVTAVLRAAGGELSIDSPLVIRVKRGENSSLPEAVRTIPRASLLLRQGSFGGRTTFESKQALRDLYGGTAESDAAVMRGLAWLARVQQQDGGWSLTGGTDGSAGGGQPTEENRVAATALALLPFLGEGVTHKSAPEKPYAMDGYRSIVERGLVFLANNQQVGRGAADGYFGSGMYAQALATTAFCEAYALSRDSKARINAQMAVKYLLDAQDEAGGGWRDAGNQPGNLSVTGLVIMALRSAKLANVAAKASKLREAERFVRSCAVGPIEHPESQYGSLPGQEADRAMTAIGLLSRQYLGWGREEPDLLAGRDFLMGNLPPAAPAPLGNLYFYYLATQVLHHLEGPEFDTWNALMRDHLIRTQNREGDLAGSWDPEGLEDGGWGGRLYATSLSLLTLQIYYRHLPMYREVSNTSDDAEVSVITAEPGSAQADEAK